VVSFASVAIVVVIGNVVLKDELFGGGCMRMWWVRKTQEQTEGGDISGRKNDR